MSYEPKKNDPKHNGQQNDPNNKRTKSIITMIIVALVFTLVINMVYTSISNAYLQQITYSEFCDMAESHQIQEVEIQHDRLLILTKEEAAKDTSKQIVYYTGKPETDELDLTEDLQARGIDVDFYITEEMNPILSVIVSWILPVAMFYLLISLVMGSMSKHMGGGGGIGGMGQSKAKMYMEKETGVTFADVAGQDEAKESLVEIIDFLHNPQKYAAIGNHRCPGAAEL